MTSPAHSPHMACTFSTLILSMASSAILALGLDKNPQTGQVEKDLELARFNIDMLNLLKVKTKNNLNAEEQAFLDSVVSDLQLKYVAVRDQKNDDKKES